MAETQQVHKLTVQDMLRVTGHLNSLDMNSGLRAHLHRQHLHHDGLKMPGKQTCVRRHAGDHKTYR